MSILKFSYQIKNIVLFLFCFLFINNGFGQLENLDLKVNSSEDYFKFYQNNISDLRGASCPMYPSCANYTLETIKEKGLIQGVINGSERLNRCGHEHKYYNLTLQEKGFKLLDQPDDQKNKNLIFKTKINYYTNTNNYEDSLIKEISFLINSGYISEAIILINRYKILNNLPNSNIIEFELICLNIKKDFEKVQYLFDLLDEPNKSNANILKQYFISCYNLENYTAIIKKQNEIINANSNNSFLLNQLNNYVFISYLNQDMLMVADSFSKISFVETNDKKNASNTVSNLLNVKHKSPLIATTLSIIIPGSGYIYGGHLTTGISALILNSLIGYASYSSFKSGNTGMGILSGIIGLGFYIGNIQGASKSIIREKTYYKNKIIKDYIKQTFIN